MPGSSNPRGGSVHEVLALLDSLGARGDFDLRDDEAGEKLATAVKELFADAKGRPHLKHGKRVEAMFEFVAASLGACSLIKHEDSGSVFTADEPQATPSDYSIVLRDGRRLLVDVKNHHALPARSWSIRSRDRQRLLRYAQLTDLPLYFAIFWSRLKLWTLVPDSALVDDGARARVTFDSAMKANFMSDMLGDVHIGTTPPLTLRVSADLAKPRAVHSDGTSEFTTSRVELLCAGRPIVRPVERQVGLYCMLYGSWDAPGWVPVLEDGSLSAVELPCVPDVRPDEPADGQEFQLLGPLSSMISRHYDSLTIRDGEVVKLRADVEANKLGVVIPADYAGEALPLWRLRQQPSLAAP